jgi:hypothetical protein
MMLRTVPWAKRLKLLKCHHLSNHLFNHSNPRGAGPINRKGNDKLEQLLSYGAGVSNAFARLAVSLKGFTTRRKVPEEISTVSAAAGRVKEEQHFKKRVDL